MLYFLFSVFHETRASEYNPTHFFSGFYGHIKFIPKIAFFNFLKTDQF